jgi:hypothetical protein
MLCIALLGAGLLALLMLNISIGKGAYELTGLQRQQRQLTVEQQALAEQVEAFGAPQELARRARELGMVPAPHTAFLTLPGGSIEGEPAVAVAPPKPKPKPATDATTAGAKSDTTTTGAKKTATKTGRTASATKKTSGGRATSPDPKPTR